MDKKTTQFDQRLSEYRDRLLQRNKEMTTDDDDRIDAIINGSADTEEMEAPAGMNEIQEQSEASEKEDTQREMRTSWNLYYRKSAYQRNRRKRKKTKKKRRKSKRKLKRKMILKLLQNGNGNGWQERMQDLTKKRLWN